MPPRDRLQAAVYVLLATATPLMSTLTDEIARRRTFAIISHPDAARRP
jgi:hypothetical protein